MRRGDWRELINASAHAVRILTDRHNPGETVSADDCDTCSAIKRLKTAVTTCKAAVECEWGEDGLDT